MCYINMRSSFLIRSCLAKKIGLPKVGPRTFKLAQESEKDVHKLALVIPKLLKYHDI